MISFKYVCYYFKMGHKMIISKNKLLIVLVTLITIIGLSVTTINAEEIFSELTPAVTIKILPKLLLLVWGKHSLIFLTFSQVSRLFAASPTTVCSYPLCKAATFFWMKLLISFFVLPGKNISATPSFFNSATSFALIIPPHINKARLFSFLSKFIKSVACIK